MSTLRYAARVSLGAFTLTADLAAGPGEVLAVLGPNGAGKSTLLRTVAGLLPVDDGRIEIGDQAVDDPGIPVFVAPPQRRVGIVFQDHRLFPHLQVLDNVAFGARCRGVSRDRARALARAWLARLDIEVLAARRPAQLSGGQAQRVALARALACEPAVLLLDEPLAALDVQTRAEVQGELRAHLRHFAGPTVLVTHDPVEALLLATRIVVLEDGQIVQHGSAAEVTARPATRYVARLVGLNLFAGAAEHGIVRLDGGGVVTAADAERGRVLVAVRPSALTVHTEAPHASSARNVWEVTITGLTPLADRIRLSTAGTQEVLVDVTAAAVAELDLAPGRPVWLTAKATDVLTYPEPVAR